LSSKTSSACSDKYPEKPKIKEKQQFLSKRFHSKKLQNIQLWLDQNLNKNSSNLDIYVIIILVIACGVKLNLTKKYFFIFPCREI
jgi:hypothetical protein